MTQFKIVVSDKNGKSISKELKDKEAQPLVGLRVGETVDASVVGIPSGKIQLRGGSDKSGTPIRKDVHGGVKKYVLLSVGAGMKDERKGIRKRKLVRGNMITEEIYQINCLLLEGNLPLAGETMESKKAESMESKKAESMESKKAESMESKKAESMESKKAESMESKKAESMESKKAESMESKKAESMESKKAESMESKKAESMESKKAQE